MRTRRWLLHSSFVVATLGALAILAVVWLVATPGGARIALDRIAASFGQGAKLSGVEGSLAGTLRVKSIEVKRPGLHVHLEDVEIERAPGNFWERAYFRKVLASRVTVRTASTGAAASMPLSFKAPYPLSVEEVRVGELRIGAIPKEGAVPPPDFVLKDVYARGEGDERIWKLDKASARTDWGVVSLAGTVGTTPPFALDLRGDLAGERGDLRYKLDARLGGTLKTIEAAFQGTERDLQVTGTAILEPFEAQPLRSATLRTADLDLRRFGALPQTRLAVEAHVKPIPHGVAGPIRIVNALPGPIDRERVPIVAVNGDATFKREGGAARLEIANARFDLAGGGHARGAAKWRGGRLEAQWQVADLDLAQWHTQLKPTRIAGSVNAVSEGDVNRFEVALSEPRFALQGRAALHPDRLDVETVHLKHAGGLVDARGSVETRGRRAFRAEGRASHFDPSAFARTAAGDLNFTFVASGALQPALSGELRADVADSRLAGMPASGKVRIAGDRQRISAADVNVALGDARIEAKGAFGAPADALSFVVQAPDLAAIGKPFGSTVGGKLDAQGTLTGTFAAPGGQATFTAANLVLPSGVRVAAASGRAEIATTADGKVDAAIEARGISQRGETTRTLAERATLSVQGTRASHRANLAATLTRQDELKAALAGGIDPGARELAWRGQLVSLELGGPSAFALTAPAPLAIAANRVELGDATLKGTWGEARFVVTRWTPALLELRGSTPGIGVRNAARALRLTTIPRGGLVVAGQWDLRAAETVDGTITLSRVSGDLRIGEPPQPIGLEELNLRIDARQGRAKAVALVRGAKLGRLNAEVSGTLQHVRAGLGIVRNAPIEGRIDAQMDSIAWMAAWMGPEARAEGRVNAALALSGTFDAPRWSGRLAGEQIVVREPTTGFEVENGVASLRLQDRTIVVETLTASTPWHPSEQALRSLQGITRPAAGTLSAQGSIDLAARTGAITVKAVSVPVTQVPTRFVAISGEGRLEARADGVLATGAFRADAGWIGALATPLPSVSDDVVVVRTRAAAPEERRPRERLRMDVRLNLGDQLWYRGRGLNTRLAGEMRVVGEPGAALRSTGSIRTVAGTYDAYGQTLAIEHGTLTFFGSLENPALNVLALRRGLPVEAGVEVLGNVSRPRVRLVSIPDVPDPEKISWLVLGRGPSDVSQGEAATLVATATALLGRGAGTEGIVRRFGFDEVRIGRSDTMSALGTLPQSTVAGKTGSASAAEVVTVGKRLSKDVYVVYEQGLADAEGALRIAWQITQHFQLLLRAGYLPGVDAVYRWTFE